MLSTEFSTGLLVVCALSVAFCVAVAIQVRRIQRWMAETIDFVRTQNKRSLSLARIAEVEATLTELLDAYNALQTSHKKLRARIGMRQNRAAKKNGLDSDEDAQRIADKKALRDKARQQGHRGL